MELAKQLEVKLSIPAIQTLNLLHVKEDALKNWKRVLDKSLTIIEQLICYHQVIEKQDRKPEPTLQPEPTQWNLR